MIGYLLLSIVSTFFVLLPTFAVEPSPFHSAKQLLVVTTPEWNSVPGTLRRFDWIEREAQWHQVGSNVPVVVGRSGLGWGKGIFPSDEIAGPTKKEGDGRSPAGIFTLSSAFGLEPLQNVSYVRLPYQQLLPPIECVDDLSSAYYNQIVARDRVKAIDWNSSEKMQAVGEQYRLGVVVDHNTHPRQAGAGSCIFLHIWKNNKTGTSGCTAMPRENMEEILHWLDAAKHPSLVQLTRAEYEKRQSVWHLPPLKQP